MHSSYDRLERGIPILVLAGAATLWIVAPSPDAIPMLLADVFRWGGVLLLGQGFFRDLHILWSRRRQEIGAARTGLLLCVESGLGLLLIAQGVGLLLLGVEAVVRLPAAGWLVAFAGWWAFGHATRNLVLELRSDPDHLNLLIGRRRGSVLE